MSILNFALQSIGMMRCATKNYENELKTCKSLSDIRQLSSKFPSLKDEVLDSVEPAKLLLCNLFKKLFLKDKPFSVFHSSSSKDMEELWNKIHKIDTTITQGDSTQKSIESKVEI